MGKHTFILEHRFSEIREISGLTREIIEKIQSLKGPNIILQSLTVGPSDMAKWVAENGLPDGLEYDIATNRVTIKTQGHAVLRAIQTLFQNGIFPRMIGKLSQHLPDEGFTVSHNKGHTLSQGGFAGDIVAADCQIAQTTSDDPRIVLLFGPEDSVFRAAKKWIRGSGGATETVIGMEVMSKSTPSHAPWGLSIEEIANMDSESLKSYIRGWFEGKKIPNKVGVFTRLFIITEKELDASAPPASSWNYHIDNTGVMIASIHPQRPTGVKLHEEAVFELPFAELQDKIKGALPAFEGEKLLFLAEQAKKWAFEAGYGGR